MTTDPAAVVRTATIAIALAMLGIGVCADLGRAADPEPTTVIHAAGEGCAAWLSDATRGMPASDKRRGALCPPYSGVLTPADTWRDMLHAQDERDAAAERLQIERDKHAIRLRACEARSDARERARAQCEAAIVPPAVEPPWSGWPWLSGAVGVVVGAGLTLLVVEAVR